jgi:hypothetical protein
MRKIVSSAVMVCAAALFTQSALAACTVSVSSIGAATIQSYDALVGGSFVAPIAIRVSNSGNSACTGMISFDASRNNDRLRGPRSETMAYLIVAEDSASRTLYDPLGGQSVSIPVMIPAGGGVELRPQLFVDGGQRGRSGRYDAIIDVSYRNATGQGRAVTSAVTVAADVVPSVQANFVGLDGGGGSSATLALGELSTGLRRSIGLQLRANTDVDVSISSENRGRLKQGGGDGTVPYDLEIGGAQVNLRQIDAVSLALGPDSVRGSTQAMEVQIGNINRAPAGVYRDTVTFRISGR